MIKPNRLYLFTSSFPYGYHENFLETEIKILSKNFEEVIIFPLISNGARRELPHNVHVKIVELTNSRINFYDFLKIFVQFFRELFGNKKGIHLIGKLRYYFSLLIKQHKIATFVSKELPAYSLCYSYWYDEWVLILGSIKKTNKIKLVSRAHGFDVYENRHEKNYIPFRKRQNRCIDFLFPVSLHAKEYLSKKYPLLKNKIDVARLGVTNNGLNNFDGSMHLLSCSSIIPLKRLDFLAEAVIRCSQPIKWTHIGSGVDLNLLQGIIENNSIHKIELKGQLTQSEIHHYYVSKSVAYFINVSTTEGFPVSIMEAMSYGIPIIAPRIGGIPELINDTNGILLENNLTVDQLTQLIEKLTFELNSNFSNYNEMRNNARITWENNLNASENYNEFTKKLKQL